MTYKLQITISGLEETDDVEGIYDNLEYEVDYIREKNENVEIDIMKEYDTYLYIEEVKQ